LSARLLDLAAPNTHLDEAVCFLGGGVADHYVPAIVDSVAAQAGLAPVGPDAPQPLLQAVFELQALFASLTALETASAPFADGPTAFAEAIRLAVRATGRREALVARSASPDYRAIAQTHLASPSLVLREAGYHGGVLRPDEVERLLSDQTACLAVDQPNYFGCLEDLPTLAAAAHRHGALLVVRVDPISLGLLAPPGQVGADIAVADAQPLGSRPAYGGSIGLLAARAALAASLPGWRVERHGDAFRAGGMEDWMNGWVDEWKKGADRLSPATIQPSIHPVFHSVRAEQIVRPIAYLAALGADGLRDAAALCARSAHETQRRICGIEGFSPRFRAPFFKEFVVESDHDPEEVAQALLESNILGGLPLQRSYPEMEGCLLFAVTERRTRADVDLLCHALSLLAGGDWEREGRPREDGSEEEDLV